MEIIEVPIEKIDEKLHKRFLEDFPEMKMFTIKDWKELVHKKIVTTWKLIEEKEVGYAITMEEQEIVLLYFFAIYKEVRSSGFGSSFLDVLKERYKDKKAIMIEVENPEEVEGETKEKRERRIRFYQKNGFKESDIEITLWGKQYLIMDFPLKENVKKEELIEAERNLYNRQFGEKVSRKNCKIQGEN